jgi:hypothetical protein
MKRYKEYEKRNLFVAEMRTRRLYNWFITMAAVAFVLVAGVAPTQATDGKIYPGSMGVRYAGTDTPSLNFSAIGNPSSTTWLYLDLPVIKDSINHNIERGWIKAIDMNYYSDITGTLLSTYRNGNQWWGWTNGSMKTSGTSSGVQTLSFGSLGANSGCHYYYSCRIPPSYNGNTSYIVSYKVDEAD